VPLFSEAQRVANRIGLRAVAKGEEPNALGGDGLGLDRVEDGDGLRRCDGPATVDGGTAVLADPERRAAIHRLHHAIVDHTYGVARDGWARALPGLHAAWEQLVEKYPGRARAAPRTQPDGSWVADGNRRLNPEQNSEACKACKDVSDEGKQVILPAMQRIEAANPDRKLAGLEHMLKGEDRLKEKIAQIDVPVESVLLETVFVELDKSGSKNVGIDFANTNGQLAVATLQSGNFNASGFVSGRPLASIPDSLDGSTRSAASGLCGIRCRSAMLSNSCSRSCGCRGIM